MQVVTQEEFEKFMAQIDRRILALETKASRKYLPVKEAAEQMGVSTRTILRRYETIIQGRRRYVRASDLGS